MSFSVDKGTKSTLFLTYVRNKVDLVPLSTEDSSKSDHKTTLLKDKNHRFGVRCERIKAHVQINPYF